jgi:hypothetical protein
MSLIADVHVSVRLAEIVSRGAAVPSETSFHEAPS